VSAYLLTPEAEQDLFAIWAYIARENLEAADRVESEIYVACAVLASAPYAGHVRPDITSLNVRFWTLPAFRVTSSSMILFPIHYKSFESSTEPRIFLTNWAEP
jgi:plasmid stabilization system protein ParE